MKKRMICAGCLILMVLGILVVAYKEKTKEAVATFAFVQNENVEEPEISEENVVQSTKKSIEEGNEEASKEEEVAEEVEEVIEEEIIHATQETENEYSNLAIADVHNYVNVRTEPNTDSEIVGKMYDGSVAQILNVVGEEDEKWFQVVSGNVEGYIKAEFFIYGDDALAVIEDYIIRYARIIADRLNVRQEPDITAKKIGYIDFDEKVKLIEYGDEWTKVQYTGNKTGYVSTQYIVVEEEFIYAKSMEEEQAELAAQAALAARLEAANQSDNHSPVLQVTPPATDYASVSELRMAIVNYALQFLGNRYIMGGQSLQNGTDCSGFTCYIFRDFGISLSRIPTGQWNSNGRFITAEEIQPGDIVCYSSKANTCTHVALYIGNGQVIHSANAKSGVIISNMYYDNTFIGIKNVID